MKHLLHQCLAKCRLHLHFELVNKFRPRSCEVPPKNLQATHQITVRITFTNLHGTAHNISNTPDHSAHYIHKPPRNSTQCLTDQSHNTTSPNITFTNLHGTAHNISNTPDHSAHYIHKPPQNSTQHKQHTRSQCTLHSQTSTEQHTVFNRSKSQHNITKTCLQILLISKPLLFTTRCFQRSRCVFFFFLTFLLCCGHSSSCRPLY